MSNGLLLIITILVNLIAYGILRNDFCKRDVQNNADLHFFNALSSVFSLIALSAFALLSGGLKAPSLYTLVLGLVFGFVTAMCAILNMRALEVGPLSYTNVLISCSMVIPALSGALFFGEKIGVLQVVGTSLMLLSFSLAVERGEKSGGVSLKWLLYCAGAMLLSGLVGVMQKIHQSSPYKGELAWFLMIAFAFSAVFSGASCIFYHSRGQGTHLFQPARRGRTLLYALLCGAGVAACNQINLYLSGVMDSILFFPAVNGGSMLLTTAAGFLLWKERLSPARLIGLACGGAAIILLCL